MALKYQTGEEIRLGDRVTWAARPSTIELVVLGKTGVPGDDWHLKSNGTGVMVRESEPKLFGRVYLHRPDEDEDLVFIGRADAT